MYAHMAKEAKDARIYFRVAPSFKYQFFAAAMVVEQDPSEAFRVMGRRFIEQIRQEYPDQFSEALKAAQEEDPPNNPGHKKGELAVFEPVHSRRSVPAASAVASGKKPRKGKRKGK